MNSSAYVSARTAARVSPDAFWAEQARRLDWMTAPTSIRDVSFNKADFRILWFGDGVLNVAYNCLDRHLETRGDETAIIWEGDEPTQSGGLTYREVHTEVCRMLSQTSSRARHSCATPPPDKAERPMRRPKRSMLVSSTRRCLPTR